MRHYRLPFLAALLLLVASFALASAGQEATPAAGFTDLGLPTLEITVTAEGYEGVPESIEAGRYLVLLTAADDSPEGGTIAFVQPAEVSAEEFLAILTGDAQGTPVATSDEVEEVDAAGSPVAAAPVTVFDATWAGGTFAEPGQTAQVVVDLTPGEWLAYGENFEGEPTVFEVTGEMPADLPEPEASATLTLEEYVIEVTEGELTAGQQIIKVENVGEQPHFVSGDKGPDDLTEEQVGAAFEAQATGTPAAEGFDPETDLTTVFYTATQTSGTTTWHLIDLDSGTYVLACFFPDVEDGLPHAYHGMYTVVQVEE